MVFTSVPDYSGLEALSGFPIIEQGEPDLLCIVEVQLAAHGFKEHAELALKTNTLIHWCKNNLAQTDSVFYDFGLSGIKGLVRASVRYLRQCSSESESVVRGLWAAFLPQLSPADTTRVTTQLHTIFPEHQLRGQDLLTDLPASVQQVHLLTGSHQLSLSSHQLPQRAHCVHSCYAHSHYAHPCCTRSHSLRSCCVHSRCT